MQQFPEIPAIKGPTAAESGDVTDTITVRLPQSKLPPQPEADLNAAAIESPHLQAIAVPTIEPDGGFHTHIGEPTNGAGRAQAAHAAQERAEHDIESVAHGLAGIAATLHTHAKDLERFVEGSYVGDLGDPHTHVLGKALQVASEADLTLARLGYVLRRLVSSVEVAISNVDALQQERERLSTLYRIAQQLNSSLDLEELLGHVMNQLIEVVRAERGFLMLWDENEHQLRFMVAQGAEQRRLAQSDFNISQGIVEGVWQSQQPLLVLDAQDDARLQQRVSIVAYGIRSVMCAPLRVRGHGVGIVYVDSRNQTALFEASHLDLLAAFCNQAAIAIDNARLFADLRQRILEISAMKTYTDNIFDSIATGVLTTDTHGQVTAFNHAARCIFGLSGDQAVGRAYQEVLASIGDDELSEIMHQAVVRNEVTLGHDIERDLPGRGQVFLRLNVSPLRQSEGESETLGAAMVVDDLTELRQSQQQTREIQRLFGRYVHPAVVRQLLADPTAVHLGGETREISVVFADIRGYTRLAEELAPEELVRVLNSYLNILTEAIWQEEGTVTMFIGDALMAIFNAPLLQSDHPQRAVRAAWAMRQALERHTGDLTSGEAQVEYGVGVHTGQAVVGNIGARDRLQNYTAIGDAVNTAQRLESNASANQILLSAATYTRVADMVDACELAPLRVKNKVAALSVYQLDGLYV
ncbi:MAG: adenylate/guanylate cyclase domain-containing protein [Ktedonobacterales bacterium]